MHRYQALPAAAAGILLTAVSHGAPRIPSPMGGAESAAKPVERIVGLWGEAKDRPLFLLASVDSTAAIPTTVPGGAEIEGVCRHCKIPLKCRASDLAKSCEVCPCGFKNAACLVDSPAGVTDGAALLRSLPEGTRLRVVFADPAAPEAGVKRVAVDRHGVLVVVRGLESSHQQEITELGRSVGATKTEWNAGTSRLQLDIKDNWTVEKQRKLKLALDKLGATIAAPPVGNAAGQAADNISSSDK